ncbi:hypothetical protein B7494_g4443 [Chlorociboria aeruginascens]|nr:hypothetical protein B7494_g4443 [Chlorociboria aeruginascens]
MQEGSEEVEDPRIFTHNITEICTQTLGFQPCCLEFSPQFPGYFVIGTYELDDQGKEPSETRKDAEEEFLKTVEPQDRSGSIVLCKLSNDKVISDNRRAICQTIPYPAGGLLDLHFHPYHPGIFGVASSTGSISLYKFYVKGDNCTMEHMSTNQLFGPEIVIMSFAWCPFPASDPSIEHAFRDFVIATLSNGEVHLIQSGHIIASGGKLTLASRLNVHDDQAYCCAFPAFPPPEGSVSGITVFSGGDDCKIRIATIPCHPANSRSPPFPPGVEARTAMDGHNAGVVSILPLPIDTGSDGWLLLTGSYDDHVRVYRAYDFRRPIVLTELYIGGGVWRLKLLDDAHTGLVGTPALSKDEVVFRILASCMYAGAKILEVYGSQHGEWQIRIVGEVNIHKSMCYASDVQPGKTIAWDEKKICVSTSFYDKLLCVWKYDPSWNIDSRLEKLISKTHQAQLGQK